MERAQGTRLLQGLCDLGQAASEAQGKDQVTTVARFVFWDEVCTHAEDRYFENYGAAGTSLIRVISEGTPNRFGGPQ